MNDVFVNKGWEKMEVLLDEHMPVQHKRRVAGYLWLFAGLLVALTAYGIYEITSLKSKETILPSASVEQFSITSNLDQNPAPTADNPNEIDNTIKSIAADQTASTDFNEKKPFTATTKSQQSATKVKNSEHKILVSPTPNLNKTPKVSSNRIDQNIAREIQGKNQQDSELMNLENSLVNNTSVSTEETNESTLSQDRFIQSAAMHALAFMDGTLLSNLSVHNISPLSYEPIRMKSKARSQLTRYEIYASAQHSDDFSGAAIGFNLRHQLFAKLSLTTGIELVHHSYKSMRAPGNTSPTSAMFESSVAFSQYLVENDVHAIDFISNITSIYLPLQVHYHVWPKLSLAIGLKPGVQLDQNLTYDVLEEGNSSRNPQVGNDGHQADDFLNQNAIAVVDASFGLNYQISNHLSAGICYHHSLSNYGRGIQYAGIDQLEAQQVGDVDRRFYSLDSKEIKPNTLDLRLLYQF
jgi:hypothetical protein